jgi:alpha-L-fucosidase
VDLAETFQMHLTKLFLILAFTVSALTAPSIAQESGDTEQLYSADWTSLEKHNEAPDWFRDAKFGIYFHWGVYCVPAYGSEWYPRHMHQIGKKENKHHVEKYGDPAEFGYEKFVPMFTAEKFDPNQWCDLFVKSGAKFLGPVAEHHDGFAMWDSEVSPWNAADMGPKRDITGELEKAARARGMKFITTFHHARNNLWRQEKNGKQVWEGHFSFAKTNYPKALEDPQRALMYGYMPREKFLEMWSDKLKEVIDKYNPDMMWFDSWLHEIPEKERQEYLAYYFNHAAKTKQEVVVFYKQKDLPQTIGVLDLEKGGMEKPTRFAWLTDDTVSFGSWCYTDSLRIKPTKVVLHSLLDIISKNGQLILNVSPKADGSIPEDQRNVLIELGQWMEKYGECVYGTRPFDIHGHGPTVLGKGHFGGKKTDIAYTAKDVRYTKKGNNVYAIALGWPGAGEATLLEGLKGKSIDSIAAVSLLGSDAEIKFEMTEGGLKVTAPENATDQMAIVYKIVMK